MSCLPSLFDAAQLRAHSVCPSLNCQSVDRDYFPLWRIQCACPDTGRLWFPVGPDPRPACLSGRPTIAHFATVSNSLRGSACRDCPPGPGRPGAACQSVQDQQSTGSDVDTSGAHTPKKKIVGKMDWSPTWATMTTHQTQSLASLRPLRAILTAFQAPP